MKEHYDQQEDLLEANPNAFDNVRKPRLRKTSETKNLLDNDEKELLTEFINYLNSEDCGDENKLPRNPRYQKMLIENFGRYIR